MTWMDIIGSWSKGKDCPPDIFEPQSADGYGSFFYGNGLESHYPKGEMFHSIYIEPILLRFAEEPRGTGLERRTFIAMCRNKERLDALKFLYDEGFLRVIQTSDGEYYFILTGLGHKIAQVCMDVYIKHRMEQFGRMTV